MGGNAGKLRKGLFVAGAAVGLTATLFLSSRNSLETQLQANTPGTTATTIIIPEPPLPGGFKGRMLTDIYGRDSVAITPQDSTYNWQHLQTLEGPDVDRLLHEYAIKRVKNGRKWEPKKNIYRNFAALVGREPGQGGSIEGLETRFKTLEQDYAAAVKKYNRLFGTRFTTDFTIAVGLTETLLDPQAMSTTGYHGISQLGKEIITDEDRHGREGFIKPYNPQDGIDGGVGTKASLYKKYKDIDLALLAYNQGPGTLNRALEKAYEQKLAAADTTAPDIALTLEDLYQTGIINKEGPGYIKRVHDFETIIRLHRTKHWPLEPMVQEYLTKPNDRPSIATNGRLYLPKGLSIYSSPEEFSSKPLAYLPKQ